MSIQQAVVVEVKPHTHFLVKNMPVNTGKDKDGCYARWGEEGKKYHYECGNENGRKQAKAKALKQGVAITINK